MKSENLVKAIIATAEVMGSTLSLSAARMFSDDLATYPEGEVLKALQRARMEVRGRLTIADVISRIDYGHIGPEEAWALCPKSESDSVVWTNEIQKAFFVALPILEDGDKVAARMAFKEAYQAEIAKAKTEKRKANWFPSLGWDKSQTETVMQKARDCGRLAGPKILIENIKQASIESKS